MDDVGQRCVNCGGVVLRAEPGAPPAGSAGPHHVTTAEQDWDTGSADLCDSRLFIKLAVTAIISPSHFLIYIMAPPKHIHLSKSVT